MKEKKTSKTKTSVFFGFLRHFTSIVFRKTPHTWLKGVKQKWFQKKLPIIRERESKALRVAQVLEILLLTHSYLIIIRRERVFSEKKSRSGEEDWRKPHSKKKKKKKKEEEAQRREEEDLKHIKQ